MITLTDFHPQRRLHPRVRREGFQIGTVQLPVGRRVQQPGSDSRLRHPESQDPTFLAQRGVLEQVRLRRRDVEVFRLAARRLLRGRRPGHCHGLQQPSIAPHQV